MKKQAAAGKKTMRLMVYLPEQTHKALRHVTIDERISATKLVEHLIEEYLAKRAKKGV